MFGVRKKISNRFSRGAALLRLISAARRFEVSEGRYSVRLARTRAEVESALRLRFQVFKAENDGTAPVPDKTQLEFDRHDAKCSHLIVVDRMTGQAVGTYRMMSIESAQTASGFYSFDEFTIEDLPDEVLARGMEIGRACIAPEHRNTKVLFLLWKWLARYLQLTGKRYFFGCCSIFSEEVSVGQSAMTQLTAAGHLHETLWVRPRKNGIPAAKEAGFDAIATQLPPLFNMYLRIGAKVCSEPMLDRDFGTIDLFVVFDLHEMTPKYKRMFFGTE